MSLYLKYRPKTIDELDLEEIRDFFHQLVKSGNLTHAYLFDGPRGSGKTSSARILAKMVNCEACKQSVCEPCGQCDSCQLIDKGNAVDLIEIDGASNRRIDDIRNLKDKIRLAPSRLKKKVYIIDEVHMLTTEAFNALLKTLEEPPEHAIFILATTEFHKLPETIVSRCLRVKFRKASKQEMIRSLSRVVKGEKGKIDDEALSLLAESVDGSFRDGVKLLEQALNQNKNINLETMRQILQGSKRDYSRELAVFLVKTQTKPALKLVRDFSDQGGNLTFLLKQVIQLLKSALLANYGLASNKLDFNLGKEGIDLIRKLDETLKLFNGAADEELLVELMILELDKNLPNSTPPNSTPKSTTPKSNSKPKPTPSTPKTSQPKNQPSTQIKPSELQARWQKILQAAGQRYSLGALLSSAQIKGIDQNKLIIGVKFAFHKQQLETEKFLSQIEQLVSEAFGFPLKVKFEVIQTDLQTPTHAENSNHEEDTAKLAEEIFLKK